MLETVYLGSAAVGALTFCILCVILLPKHVLLASLVLARSVSDIGGSSEAGTLLPYTAILAALAFMALLAAALPNRRHLGQGAKRVVLIASGAITFWTAVAIFFFGFDIDFITNFVRLLSLAAMIVLAYRMGVETPEKLPSLFNVVVGIPAVLLIVGYVIQWSPMLNAAGRATGTFNHANSAAAFFAVGVLVCIWGYWRSRRILSLAVALLALVALLLTQSLGALSGLLVGAVVLFSINSKLPLWQRLVLIASAGGLVLTLFLSIGASGRIAELENASYNDQRIDNSFDWRLANWRQLINIWWSDGPLLGHGLGATLEKIQPMGALPHSVVVQLLVETGIVGLIVAVVLASILAKSIRRRYSDHPGTAAAVAAISVTIFIHGTAANWLDYGAAQYLGIFTVCAMLGSSGCERRAGSQLSAASTAAKTVRVV